MTDQIHLSATAELDEAPERPKIEVLAYSGSEVRTAAHGKLIVDLKGIDVQDEVPILRDHDPKIPLGFVTAHRIDETGLHVTATISADNEHSRDILTHQKNGFRWRASVGLDITEKQTLPRGRRAYINGRHVSGPATIAKRSEIFEVSLTSLPADKHTHATVRASKDQVMSEIIEAEDRDRVELERERLDRLDELRAKYLDDPLQTNRDRIAERLSRAVDDGSDPKEVEVDCLRLTKDFRDINPRHVGLSRVAAPERVSLSLLCQSGHGEFVAEKFGEQVAEDAARFPIRLSELFDERRIARLNFSTNDVSRILQDAANKSALASYGETASTWESFAAVRGTRDYKENHGLRISNLRRLEPVGKGGEINHTVFGDDEYKYRVRPFAQMVGLTEEDVRNDDLGMFGEIIPGLVRAAKSTADDAVYEVLADATSGSHWSAARENKLDAGSALSGDSLQSAITLMRRQKHPSGGPLGLVPRTLVVAPEDEFVARSLLSSTEILGSDGPAGNPLKGIVGLEVEPRLESPNWFLFGGPEAVPVIVAYLDGVRQPRVETEPAAFNRLGVQFRVVHRFGVALGDPKASVYATGAGE